LNSTMQREESAETEEHRIEKKRTDHKEETKRK
jgi:hypothetical protein